MEIFGSRCLDDQLGYRPQRAAFLSVAFAVGTALFDKEWQTQYDFYKTGRDLDPSLRN